MTPDRPRGPLDPFMLPAAVWALWAAGWRLMTKLVGRRLLLAGLAATTVVVALIILFTGG